MDPETHEEVIAEEPELSIGDELRAAMAAAEEPATEEVPEAVTEPVAEQPPTDGRARDAQGRFVKTDEQPLVEAPAVVENAAPEGESTSPDTTAAPPGAAPPNWRPEAQAEWDKLPQSVKDQVIQREADIHKQATKVDGEREFGRTIQKIAAPYMPQIQAEGGSVEGALSDYLNMAYIMRQGTPEQKRQLLMNTAQQFGVDIAPRENEPAADPVIAPLIQRIESLETGVQKSQLETRQALQAEINSDIEAFASDPANEHFETVRSQMATLMASGAHDDLKSAYDAACWSNPEIRATLQAAHAAAEEQKRREAAKAKAEEARKKAVSVTGSPGVATLTAPVDRDLRSELEHNYHASTGAV